MNKPNKKQQKEEFENRIKQVKLTIRIYLGSSRRKLTKASSTERTRCLQDKLSLIREANSSTCKYSIAL